MMMMMMMMMMNLGGGGAASAAAAAGCASGGAEEGWKRRGFGLEVGGTRGVAPEGTFSSLIQKHNRSSV